MDGGYTGRSFADAVKSLSKAEIEAAKRSELPTFAVILKRWVAGLINVVGFGKIVNGNYRIRFKW